MDLIPFPFFPKLCWIFSLSSSYSNQIVLPMAGANSFSALLSLLVVLSCIMVGQVFKPLLADSRQGNLAAGGWYFSSPFLTMICFVKTSLPHSFQHSICPPPPPFSSVLGSLVFAFALTALSNLKMASAGASAKCGLFECAFALFVGCLSSASIHRISITLCVLFSAVLLFFLTGISHKRYGTDLPSAAAVGGGKKRK